MASNEPRSPRYDTALGQTAHAPIVAFDSVWAKKSNLPKVLLPRRSSVSIGPCVDNLDKPVTVGGVQLRRNRQAHDLLHNLFGNR